MRVNLGYCNIDATANNHRIFKNLFITNSDGVETTTR